MNPAGWNLRWRDDLAERFAFLEAEGIPDAEAKARAMVDRCRRREEQKLAGLDAAV